MAQSLYDAPSLRAALIEVLARASERAASRAICLALKERRRIPAALPVVVEERRRRRNIRSGTPNVLLFILRWMGVLRLWLRSSSVV